MEHDQNRPLTFPVAFPDVPTYLVYCNVTREVAHQMLGLPMMTSWVDGLGNGDFWAFEYPCGLQIAYEFLHDGFGGRVVADSPEINHVMRHMPFPENDCCPIEKEGLNTELRRLLQGLPHRQQEIEQLHAFQVWRQDDNGNTFSVGATTSERDAKCWVKQFEALGHKQTYWYTRDQ